MFRVPCRRRSLARQRYESVAGTSTPRGSGTSRWDIGLFDCHSYASSVIVHSWTGRHVTLKSPDIVGRTFCLVYVIPGTLSTQDVFDFLLLQILALVVTFVDYKVVGTSKAFETVLADRVFGCRVTGGYFGHAKHVAACWADYGC